MRGTRLGIPYTRTQDARERACDRHADASSICANRANPPCVHCAPRADPACDRFAQTGQASPILREASCVPSDGTLAFRRSTWDFWPGPVLAVVRPASAEASAGIGAARQSLGDGAAVPPGLCVDLFR